MRREQLVVFGFVAALIGIVWWPLALVAVAISGGVILSSRKRGSTPILSLITLVVCVLSYLLTSRGKPRSDTPGPAQLISPQLATRLLNTDLAVGDACALAAVYFERAQSQKQPTRCTGDFIAGPISRLSHFQTAEGPRTLCFARAHRWYVMAAPADGVCLEWAPPFPDEKPGTELAFEQQEEALRSRATVTAARGRIDRYLARMNTVGMLLREHTHHEMPCPALQRGSLSRVDADLLFRVGAGLVPESGELFEPWELLSDKEHGTILDPEKPMLERLWAVDQALSRPPLMAVFHGTDGKRRPRLIQGKTSAPQSLEDLEALVGPDRYVGGAFDGWLTLVDTAKGQIVCESALVAESSETARGFGLKSLKPSAQNIIDEDFAAAIRSRATSKLAEMTNSTVELWSH